MITLILFNIVDEKGAIMTSFFLHLQINYMYDQFYRILDYEK